MDSCLSQGRGETIASTDRDVGCWPRQLVTHAEERCGEVAFVDPDLWLQGSRNLSVCVHIYIYIYMCTSQFICVNSYYAQKDIHTMKHIRM